MLAAVSYDLDAYGSFLTTSTAAEIFWAIFVVAAGAAFFVLARRPRRRKRTWTYDVPPQFERRSAPSAERFRSEIPR